MCSASEWCLLSSDTAFIYQGAAQDSPCVTEHGGSDVVPLKVNAAVTACEHQGAVLGPNPHWKQSFNI